MTFVYIAGALLELGGIALVALDVRDSQRQLQEMSDPHWGLRTQPRSLFQMIAEASAGNVRRRAIGVALIAIGVVVQTVGNIAAL